MDRMPEGVLLIKFLWSGVQKKGGDDASRLTAQLREVAAGGTAAGAVTASAPRNAPPASVDAVLEQR